MIKRHFPKLLFFISITIFFYTIFKSEIYWEGKLRDYYFKYYLFSLILILFSLITFLLNNKIKKFLGIFFLSTYLSLFLFEIFLSIKYSKTYISYPKNYDLRTPYEFFTYKKKKNKDIKMVIKPYDHLEITQFNQNYVLPASGISKSQTINCNENGYYSIYLSDRYGFNNPDDVWESNQTDYLLIGDSFVHGACVNSPHDIASNLRDLTYLNVINLGFRSNGPLIELSSLREYLPENTKNIIWFYYEGNDLKNLKKELKNKILIKYFKNDSFSQNLKKKQNQIDNQANLILKKKIKEEAKNNQNKLKINTTSKPNLFLQSFKLYNLREFFFKDLVNKYKIKTEQAELLKDNLLINNFFKIINQAKDISLKNDINFYFVYIPDVGRYLFNQSNESYEIIIQGLKKNQINFIYLKKDLFDIEEDPFKFFSTKRPGHFNPQGYKKITSLILEKISD